MAQLQRMDTRLDILSLELYQVNVCVGHIARWQATIGGVANGATPSPPPSGGSDCPSEDDDDGDDDDASNDGDDDDALDDDDGDVSSTDEMST